MQRRGVAGSVILTIVAVGCVRMVGGEDEGGGVVRLSVATVLRRCSNEGEKSTM